MIEKLRINEESKLHQLLGYTELELKKLTILMGPNGAGKSSLLQGLASKSGEQGHGAYHRSCGEAIEVITKTPFDIDTLSSRQDNGKYRGYFSDDLSADLTMLFQSEGQSTVTMFSNWVLKLIKKLNRDPEKQITVLMDELDSGVSFENILIIISVLQNLQIKFPQLQVILTAHNYEFARRFPGNTLWVPSGKFVDMSNYDVYTGFYHALSFLHKFKSNE